MNSTASRRRSALAFAGALALVFATGAIAQVQTETTTTSGQATHETTVTSATVAYVMGNELVVKLADGSLKHFPNVPESARVTINGQQLGIHELKPGMVITRTTVKSTTPEVITTVKSVKGKVWHVNPPLAVILTLEDGTNQEFKIPNGQKFIVNGQSVDAWGLKKGMIVNATKVVEVPQTTVAHSTTYTATAPPAPPADQPILVAVVTPVHAAPAPAPAPAAAAPASLPKTASELPLLGLLGLMCLGSSFGLRLLRQR
jgi:hypothetical protein